MKTMTDHPLKKEFYDRLQKGKIEINWNKSPIEMGVFLSFLTCEVVRSLDHSGSSMGWTLLQNESIKLKIHGGIVGGKEYINQLEYGVKMENRYNNFVNPFYLFDILSAEGKCFFLNYYKGDIEDLISERKHDIKFLEEKLADEKATLQSILIEVKGLQSLTPCKP